MVRSVSRRPLVAAVFLAMTSACGNDGGDSQAGSEGAAENGRGTGQAAQSVVLLPPEALSAYLPAQIGDYRPVAEDVDYRWERGAREIESARVNIPYAKAGANGAPDMARPLEVSIEDLGGQGAARQTTAALYYEDLLKQGTTESEHPALDVVTRTEARRLDDGTILATRRGPTALPHAEMWIGERYKVTMRSGSADPVPDETVQAFADLYDASPLGDLAAGGDVRAEQPAWLTDGTPGGAETEPLLDVLGRTPGACNAILPPEDVASVCGIASIVIRPTGFETEGENCNRTYRAEAGGSGLTFMVTAYDGPDRAQSAVRTGAMSDEPSYEVIPDLGDGGSSVVLSGGPTPDRYSTRFSVANLLVEMVATDDPFTDEANWVCNDVALQQELGRGIVTRVRSMD